jgi:hypothetical protein
MTAPASAHSHFTLCLTVRVVEHASALFRFAAWVTPGPVSPQKQNGPDNQNSPDYEEEIFDGQTQHAAGFSRSRREIQRIRGLGKQRVKL